MVGLPRGGDVTRGTPLAQAQMGMSSAGGGWGGMGAGYGKGYGRGGGRGGGFGRGGGSGRGAGGRTGGGPAAGAQEDRIYICGLPRHVNEHEMETFFSQIGPSYIRPPHTVCVLCFPPEFGRGGGADQSVGQRPTAPRPAIRLPARARVP